MQQDAALGGKLIRRRGSRHPCANDHEIKHLHISDTSHQSRHREATLVIEACMRSCRPRQVMPASAARACLPASPAFARSEEHTSELQSLMRISYAVFCLKKKNPLNTTTN